MKKFLLLLALLQVWSLGQADLLSLEARGLCEIFKLKFQKKYATDDEDTSRCGQILANKRLVDNANSQNLGFTLEQNKFSDLSLSEFGRTYLGLKLSSKPPAQSRATPFVSANVKLAASVNLTKSGYVTRVKDQGACGSCWAFAATGAMETANILKNKKSTTLSDQQLVSCDNSNSACDGGWITTAFEYVFKAGGIQSDSDYQYKSGSNGRERICKFRKYLAVAAKLNSTKYVEIDDVENGDGNVDDAVMRIIRTYGKLNG